MVVFLLWWHFDTTSKEKRKQSTCIVGDSGGAAVVHGDVIWDWQPSCALPHSQHCGSVYVGDLSSFPKKQLAASLAKEKRWKIQPAPCWWEAMSGSVGQLQCWLVGIHKSSLAAQKNKTTINLCSTIAANHGAVPGALPPGLLKKRILNPQQKCHY